MSKRNNNIDIIKAIAIISVIVLHSISTENLFDIGAPYHIWQAVPLFMILSGYNAVVSYKKRNYEKISELYNIKFLYNKLKRLLYPFLLVLFVQILAIHAFWGGVNIKQIYEALIYYGGWGPGSYFVPIIIQATLILPLIYLWCKKSTIWRPVILFIVSILLEYICLKINMSERVYRVLIIRYIFALTLGVWLAINKEKINYKRLIPLAIISLIYITGVNYFGWAFIMEKFWLSQHAPAYFWTLLMTIIFLNLYEFRSQNILSKLLIKIGKASYHIFLMQMVYFWKLSMKLPDMPLIMYIFISLVWCLSIGMLFYDTESNFKKIIRRCKGNSIIFKS